MKIHHSVYLVTFGCLLVHAAPQSRFNSRTTSAVTVQLGGVNYVNKGLVAFGLIPSNFTESTGDTLGGIGSAIAFKRGTWKLGSTSGTYEGTLVVHPDRGYNVETTIDYQSRSHEISFILTPYTSSTPLSFTDAQKTLKLTYLNTTLKYERQNRTTTGLDGLAVRSASNGDPDLPIDSDGGRLSLDVEGLVANADGSYWISDEYGPYIYLYTAQGQLVHTIQPPKAFLPFNKKGKLTFTSDDDPATGRQANGGFEGLTLDATTQTLYALLQSALIQDGGDDKTTARYTRLLAYSVAVPTSPKLVGEWVVPLPLSSKGKTLAQSEILYVSEPGVFLVLARDGDGKSGDDNNSKYKKADLFSIANATNIAGLKYDDPSNPVAKKGKLVSDVVPAVYTSFVDYLDDDQLARFGLHNDDPSDATLINAKWESLALAPVGDPAFPDDFFLFTVSDNDFISTHGISLGVPFNAGLDVDNQFLVFQVTLPGAKSVVERSIGTSP